MQRKAFLIIAVLFFLSVFAFPVSNQIEFVATLQEVAVEEDEVTLLTVELTPAVSFPVVVTETTEIRDEGETSISVGELAPGMTLKIRGVFTGNGILAQEIEIVEDGSQFEIQGILQAVEPSTDDDGGQITVAGFSITVPVSAEIRNRFGDPLGFSDLAPGQSVQVEGFRRGEALVARQVTVRTARDGFARIRLEGVVTEIRSDSEIVVDVEGSVSALVEITEDTEIRGDLVVGAVVRVTGTLTERLTVLARRIVVLEGVRLEPRELEMGFGQMRRVSVILRSPLDRDAVFSLLSENPDVADPVEASITIPAGMLTGSFQVASGDQEGRTAISVAAEGLSATLPVEVEEEEDDDGGGDDRPDRALRLTWEPRVIQAAPRGVREVRLRINDAAPEDLIVEIGQRRGSPDFVSFPQEVLIPQGSRVVTLEIMFLKDRGEAVLRAVLPDSAGGDEADLEIRLKSEKAEKLRVEWSPDDVELDPASDGRVELALDGPAPYDLEAVITVKNGDRSLLESFPSRVEFLEGESVAVIEFRTADKTGKVRLRAALPFEVGGAHDDLKIEVDD